MGGQQATYPRRLATHPGRTVVLMAWWNDTVPPDDFVDLENVFSEVAVELFGSPSVEGTLQRIVDLAAATIDGCDAAGVLVVGDSGASTPAASAPFVGDLEQAQIDLDEGPCLDAARSGTTFYAADLADDDRWPAFAPTAIDAGVRSVLAYAISGRQLSALNLYARFPAAFGATDRAQGQLFATLARLALDSAAQRAVAEENAGHLGEALETREVIGQAQGILMERERISAERAFDLLRRASQRMNVKLRDVARGLVERGEAASADEEPGYG